MFKLRRPNWWLIEPGFGRVEVSQTNLADVVDEVMLGTDVQAVVAIEHNLSSSDNQRVQAAIVEQIGFEPVILLRGKGRNQGLGSG